MKIIGSVSAFQQDLDSALGRIAALGFDAVDLILIESWGLVSVAKLLDDFDGEVARVRGLLNKHGLTAASVNTAFKPDLHERADAQRNAMRRRQVEAVCRFMNALGIRIGAHYPGHIADWKNDPGGVWRDTLESLREIQAIAREYGVALAPELHFRTPFEQPDQARRLLREIPGLPYTYEPSHFIMNGIDFVETADLLDGAVHCHLRTSAPGKLQTPACDGIDALDRMIARLRERDYPGYVSIEYLPKADFNVEAAIAALKQRYDQAEDVMPL